MNEQPERLADDEARLLAVKAQLDVAQGKLDAAEIVWRKAQVAFRAETRPLYALMENLCCNPPATPGGEGQN